MFWRALSGRRGEVLACNVYTGIYHIRQYVHVPGSIVHGVKQIPGIYRHVHVSKLHEKANHEKNASQRKMQNSVFDVTLFTKRKLKSSYGNLRHYLSTTKYSAYEAVLSIRVC
jgi:hypothetical protein